MYRYIMMPLPTHIVNGYVIFWTYNVMYILQTKGYKCCGLVKPFILPLTFSDWIWKHRPSCHILYFEKYRFKTLK